MVVFVGGQYHFEVGGVPRFMSLETRAPVILLSFLTLLNSTSPVEPTNAPEKIYWTGYWTAGSEIALKILKYSCQWDFCSMWIR